MRAIFIIIVSFFCIKSYAQGDNQEVVMGQPHHSPHFYGENGKIGLQRNSRKHLTPAIYDTLIILKNNSYVGKRFSTNKQQALWGLLGSHGDILLPFEFFTCDITGDYLILGTAANNRVKKGVYDYTGKQIITPRYENISITQQHIVARSGKVNNVFVMDGRKIGEFKADSISLLDNNYLVVYRAGKAGLETLDHSMSLAAEYEAIRIENAKIYGKRFPQWQLINGYDTIVFHRQDIKAWGDYIIASTGKKSQVINKAKEKISHSYDKIVPVSKNLAKVQIANRWGVINAHGKEIIPVNYCEIIADKEFIGARAISNVPKWFIYDVYGYLKTQLIYDSIKSMSEGRLPVKRNDRWGYLDRYGVEIIAPIFEKADKFKNQQAHVRFFGQSGIIDRSGKWLIPPINRQILDFNSKVLLTKLKKQFQVLSYADELIYFTNNTLELTPLGIDEFDSVGKFIRKISWEGTILADIYSGENIRTGGSGLTIFKDHGRYGFKDQLGRIIIANRYEEVKPFHQDLAAIKIRNKWGFIDLDEIIRVQPIYDSVGHFVNGSCLVRKNEFLGVIDNRGEVIISPKYNHINRLSNNTYRVVINDKWGLIGEYGQVIIHPKYDLLKTTDQGYFIVRRNERYGSISDAGISQIPLRYEYIDFDRRTKSLVLKKSHNEKWVFLLKTHQSN